jgi:hypothetical protein
MSDNPLIEQNASMTSVQTVGSKAYDDKAAATNDLNRQIVKHLQANNVTINALMQMVNSFAQKNLSPSAAGAVGNITGNQRFRGWTDDILFNEQIRMLYGGGPQDVTKGVLQGFGATGIRSNGVQYFGGSAGSMTAAGKVSEYMEKMYDEKYAGMGTEMGVIMERATRSGAFNNIDVTRTDKDGITSVTQEFEDISQGIMKEGTRALTSLKKLFGKDKGIGELMSIGEAVVGGASSSVDKLKLLADRAGMLTVAASRIGMDQLEVGQSVGKAAEMYRAFGFNKDMSTTLAMESQLTAMATIEQGRVGVADQDTRRRMTQNTQLMYGAIAGSDAGMNAAVIRGFIARNKGLGNDEKISTMERLMNEDFGKNRGILNKMMSESGANFYQMTEEQRNLYASEGDALSKGIKDVTSSSDTKAKMKQVVSLSMQSVMGSDQGKAAAGLLTQAMDSEDTNAAVAMIDKMRKGTQDKVEYSEEELLTGFKDKELGKKLIQSFYKGNGDVKQGMSSAATALLGNKQVMDVNAAMTADQVKFKQEQQTDVDNIKAEPSGVAQFLIAAGESIKEITVGSATLNIKSTDVLENQKTPWSLDEVTGYKASDSVSAIPTQITVTNSAGMSKGNFMQETNPFLSKPGAQGDLVERYGNINF